MTELPRPVRRVLRDLEPPALDRAWAHVRTRRARRGRARTWGFAVAAALAAAIVAFVVTRPVRPGPLRADDGHDVRALSATERAESVQRFEDGSRISLAQGSQLVVVDNSARVFTTLLVTGRADIEVRPGGPRTWMIECGLATVEVVGTHFVIERDERSVRVAVERGAVVVRSDRLVPDRVRRLAAGEELRIEREPSPPSAPSAPPSSAASSVSMAPTAPPNAAAPQWRELAGRRDFKGAYRALGSAGLAAETNAATGEDLFTLADVARLSGHPADAVAPLRRIVAAGGQRAALASFTLAKIELDALGRSAEAADDLSRALALGLPGGLVEDAQARRVEALGRAGQRDAARAAAHAFLAAFPDSPRRPEMDRWLAP